MKLLILLPLLLPACGRGQACEHASASGRRAPAPGESARCALGGGRSYDVVLPESEGPLPVIVFFHGGGGSAEGAPGSTAPDGEADHESALSAVATARGFAVVYAEGTPSRVARRLHTWNAGGGEGEWQCVSGRACKDGVDDVAYVRDLLDDLSGWVEVDPDRVFATGISNGAAMSYRVAHELPDRFAAIAPVGGADQLGVSTATPAPVPTPVLHIHGTEDPCWPTGGGAAACLQEDGKAKASLDETFALWAQTNGCAGEPTAEALPDAADDGTRSTLEHFSCANADFVHWRIEGGGHTWPDGSQYLDEATIGRVERDVNGNEQIVAFFAEHPRQ